MKNKEITNSISRTFNRSLLKLKKHSPEILVTVGVIGTVASAVMACKATTKVSAIIDEAKETIDTIHECAENPEMEEKYTEEDSKKDLAIVYAQTGLKLAKLYAPSIILGVASLGCVISSNNILRKRNIALAAAYTTVNTSFKEYRNRVIDRFGKELDRELKYNIKAKEIEETTVDDKGKEKKVKKTVNVVDPNTYSEYARFFDCGCVGWEDDSEYNHAFLMHQQNHANDLLKSRGHLYLNEVYDMLGIPRTKAGQVVGWVYDEKDPVGDNFVDFGILDYHKEKVIDFVNGYEKVILLDFNVDGNIWELMK
jgi:hypothetical protein